MLSAQISKEAHDDNTRKLMEKGSNAKHQFILSSTSDGLTMDP